MLHKIRDYVSKYWLYVLVATLPFERIPSLDATILGRNVTLRLSLVVAVISILALIWKERPRIRLGAPYFWILSYGIVMVLSAIFSQTPARSTTALVATGIMMLVAIMIAENLAQFSLRRIFKILTIVTVGACLFGLYQFLGDSLGLPIALTGLKAMYAKAVFGFPRIQSTGLEPLYFANFLTIPLLLTAKLLTSGLLKIRPYLAILFLYCVTLFLTLSRGGIIASLLGLSAILAFGLFEKTGKKMVAALVFIMVLAAGSAIGMVSLSGYITQQKSPTSKPSNVVTQYIKQSSTLAPTSKSADSDRLTDKELALEIFKSHPILGVGIGNFGNYARLNYAAYRSSSPSTIVNNEYYEILAETGVLGIVSIFGLFLSIFYFAIKKLLTIKDQERRSWIVALLCTMLAFAVQYYAFSTLYIMHIWVVVGIVIGLARPSGLVPSKASQDSD